MGSLAKLRQKEMMLCDAVFCYQYSWSVYVLSENVLSSHEKITH